MITVGPNGEIKHQLDLSTYGDNAVLTENQFFLDYVNSGNYLIITPSDMMKFKENVEKSLQVCQEKGGIDENEYKVIQKAINDINECKQIDYRMNVNNQIVTVFVKKATKNDSKTMFFKKGKELKDRVQKSLGENISVKNKIESDLKQIKNFLKAAKSFTPEIEILEIRKGLAKNFDEKLFKYNKEWEDLNSLEKHDQDIYKAQMIWNHKVYELLNKENNVISLNMLFNGIENSRDYPLTEQQLKDWGFE